MRVTAISRCAGQNHVHMTFDTSYGTLNRSYEIADLIAPSSREELEEYLRQRVKQMVRQAQGAGNTTYAQIRTYLLNLGEFIE